MPLSKSNFQTGRRCAKRLWHEKHRVWQAEPSANDAKNALEGNRFNEAVRAHCPEGIMVGWEYGNIEAAADKTKALLLADEVILFEAVFAHNDLLCLADVVIKKHNTLTLIEAKSSNNPKVTQSSDFEHIFDAAFQTYVMQQCGHAPDQVLLLHANGECVWPDPEHLFQTENITDDVYARLDEIALEADRQIQILAQHQSPEVAIGKFCKKPADKLCPHIETCWQKPVARTIYDLPHMSDQKINTLALEGIHLIEDIPTNTELSSAQRHTVQLIQNQTEHVDKAQVHEHLATLTYPIHFFDFETYNPAVPMWPQSRPWQQVPFQYSLHLLHEDGHLEHFEFLHTDATDPRPELLKAMQAHFLSQGSIVVYYAPFERGRLTEMARDLPEYESFLDDLTLRVWDQLDVFKSAFDDHRLALSKSIKVVLPTFVPALSYKTLSVQKGDQAQLQWRKMIDPIDPSAKQALIEDLKKYCEMDTLAMVKLHEYLLELVGQKG